MKVLVCGGAGYIGTHLVRALLRNTEHSVIIADSLEAGNGNRSHLETEENWVKKHGGGAAPSGARFATLEVGDVRNLDFLDEVFTRHGPIDAVVHMCAYIVVPESVRDPLRYYDNNVLGMIRLLQAMHKHGCDKLIFSSTAALFGNPFTASKRDGRDPRLPIGPDAATDPESPYGETKLVCEWILRDSAAAYGIKSVCLRYFNACGAHPDGDIGEAHEPESHLIPLILRVPLRDTINTYNAAHHPERPLVKDHISIFGTDYDTPDGTCIRDYVHVNDLASAHICALSYLSALGPKDSDKFFSQFNLGTSQGHSVKEVIESARRVTGHAIPAKEEPRREGDPPVLVASGDRAKEVLGWKPVFTSIDDIIETAWNFHKRYPVGSSGKPCNH